MDSFVHQADSDGNDKQHNDLANNLFLTNLLSTLPKLDSLQAKRWARRKKFLKNILSLKFSSRNDNAMNGNSFFTNILDPFNNGRSSSNVLSSYGNYNMDSSNPIDIFCNSGNQKTRHISPSTSPHTNSSSSSSQSVFCGHCDNNAINRCIDCNDVFCGDCIHEHAINAFTKTHTIVGLGKITPIGSVTSTSILHSVNIHASNEPQCEIHGEALRFLCETCKKVVCQECTLKDHKDHDQTPISSITTEKAKEKLKAIHDSSKLGIKYIKTSIDRAVAYSQSIERDSLEIQSRVKKNFRLLILAAEDRERTMLEQIDKYRQQKVANLSDQMTGLRSALGTIDLNDHWNIYANQQITFLAGLAETSECLAKSVDSVTDNTSKTDIAFLLANTENQIEKFAAMYKNLQPKEESLTFIQPSFELIQEIRNQGEIVINCRNNMNFQQNQNTNGSNTVAAPVASLVAHRQTPRATDSPHNGDQLLWDSTNGENGAAGGNNGAGQVIQSKMTYASIVKPAATISGQCIPGSSAHVNVKPALAPSEIQSFRKAQTEGLILIFFPFLRIDLLHGRSWGWWSLSTMGRLR